MLFNGFENSHPSTASLSKIIELTVSETLETLEGAEGVRSCFANRSKAVPPISGTLSQDSGFLGMLITFGFEPLSNRYWIKGTYSYPGSDFTAQVRCLL